jgi:molybdopterin-guanine dinucleotide biosynthesis protein B
MTSTPESSALQSNPSCASPRALGVVGFANSGKTGLICGLLPHLSARGLQVAVLKHSHHPDLDRMDEGKDTWRYRQAGANAVAVAAPGLVQVTRSFPGEPPLQQALAMLAGQADLIVVEGYKTGPLPKVAVLGPEEREAPDYPNLIALVSDRPVNSPLPVFAHHQVDELAAWLYDYLGRN